MPTSIGPMPRLVLTRIVEHELPELQCRLAALAQWIESWRGVTDLDATDQHRLFLASEQLRIMQQYETVLSSRVLFNDYHLRVAPLLRGSEAELDRGNVARTPVFEIVRRTKRDKQVVLARLAELGIPASNVMSRVDPADALRVIASFEGKEESNG